MHLGSRTCALAALVAPRAPGHQSVTELCLTTRAYRKKFIGAQRELRLRNLSTALTCATTGCVARDLPYFSPAVESCSGHDRRFRASGYESPRMPGLRTEKGAGGRMAHLQTVPARRTTRPPRRRARS